MFPTTRYGKLTLLATLLEAFIVIALEAVVAGYFLKYYDRYGGSSKNGNHRGVPVYLAIFILTHVCSVILCWDAVNRQNTIQIIGFIVFNLLAFVYSIFQLVQMRTLVTTTYLEGTVVSRMPDNDASVVTAVLVAIPVVLGIFEVILTYCAFKLYLEFGWKIYKKIGANPAMRNMYRLYQIFLMLLKFDVFFILGFCIQFLVLVITDPNDPEFGLTIAALPILIVVPIIAVYGVRREDRWIMSLFGLSLLLTLAYFLFKLIRIYTMENVKKEYSDTKYYLTLFSIMSLLVVAMTLIVAILCVRNFGKGLKEFIVDKKKPEVEQASDPNARKPIDG